MARIHKPSQYLCTNGMVSVCLFVPAHPDEESTPGDVDDRTESDQSVGGRDDDDSDLSSLAYGLGDTPLDDGRQVIIYRHHPNQNLNSMLTWLAVTSLMLALGVGIGHFLGRCLWFLWLILSFLRTC